MNEYKEGEIVRHLFGYRIRIYAGHTGKPRRRMRYWRSDLDTRGVFIVPWGSRVFGLQWRRNAS